MKFRNHLAGCAANQGPKSCENFLHSKRFGHVIVRAAVNALNLFVPAPPRRQDEDRHLNAGFAPSSKHGESVHFREAKVEQRGIVSFRLSEKIRALSVIGTIHRIPGAPDSTRELFAQRRLILDNQDPQANLHAHISRKLAERQMNGAFKAGSGRDA
jgi:hypothetical protein